MVMEEAEILPVLFEDSDMYAGREQGFGAYRPGLESQPPLGPGPLLPPPSCLLAVR